MKKKIALSLGLGLILIISSTLLFDSNEAFGEELPFSFYESIIIPDLSGEIHYNCPEGIALCLEDLLW